MPHPSKGSGGHPDEGRPIENLIRAAMRGGELLIPATTSEAELFRSQVASKADAVPPDVLNPHWLFECGDPEVVSATPRTPTPTEENFALAARGGRQISDKLAVRMAADRASLTDGGQRVGLNQDVHTVTDFASDRRLREIAELAEWVANANCPSGQVDPEVVAASERLGISYNDYDDAFDGLLEHRSGAFHVFCNLRRVVAPRSDRARFTLAHELGHYFIDAHRRKLERGESLPLSQCEFESAQPIEREADHFAAHMLMPSKRFVRELRGALRGLPAVLALRQRFGTSVTSTACRYTALSNIPCAVVKWSPSGNVWRVLSPQAHSAGWGRVIDSQDKLPAGSATARAIAGEAVPSSGFFQTGSTLADWFGGVAADSIRNNILLEQAIPLGRYGVLTLLVPASGEFRQAI